MLRKVTRIFEQPNPSAPTPRLASAAGNPEVLEELRRVLESQEFAGSERGRTLLTYLVENALNGGLDRLKERTIGVEIFGRDVAYDTGQDAIVRVSANSIRKRLASYYTRMEAAGDRSDLRIYLAPGSYTPEFLIEPHHPEPVPEPEPKADAPPTPVAANSRRSWGYPAAIAVLTLGCGVLGFQNWHQRTRPAAPEPLAILPWSMFGSPSEAPIALTDANFTMHKFINRRQMALTEYTSARWLWDFKGQGSQATPLSVVPYTSVASAVTAVRIGALLQRAGCSALVRSARNLQLRDFKEDRPIVLLGSAPSNPWVELFDDKLNFVIDVEIERRIQRVRNHAPQAGEEAFYTTVQTAESPGVAYAVISALPNLARKAPVLIIAGTNPEATEAAGELATDIPRLTGELKKLGINPAAKVTHLELLIRVQHLGEAPSRSEVIAHRVTP